MSPSWSVFPSPIRARSETWSLAQDGVSAVSPCSGQRIDGSRAVTNASNAITSGWRHVPSVNSTVWQARPHCGHGNREPARKPKRRSTRRRAKSKSLLTTRHGGSSCNASSKSCFMLRTGTPSVNDWAWYPREMGRVRVRTTRTCAHHRQARYPAFGRSSDGAGMGARQTSRPDLGRGAAEVLGLTLFGWIWWAARVLSRRRSFDQLNGRCARSTE